MQPQTMYLPQQGFDENSPSYPVFAPVMYVPQMTGDMLANQMCTLTTFPQQNQAGTQQLLEDSATTQQITTTSDVVESEGGAAAEGQASQPEIMTQQFLSDSQPQMQAAPQQFVQPFVFSQVPMHMPMQPMQHFTPYVPYVIQGSVQPFTPGMSPGVSPGFSPMLVMQPPLQSVSLAPPEQHPVMRSDSSHSRRGRSNSSYDGGEHSGDPKSNSLQRFSSDLSRDGFGSDLWDNRSRAGTDQDDDKTDGKGQMQFSYVQDPNTMYFVSNNTNHINNNNTGNRHNGPVYSGRTRSSRERSRSSSQKRPTSKERQEELYKSELCSAWVNQRKCRFGHRCIFAHGQHELRTAQRKQDRQKNRPPLKAYVTGLLTNLTDSNADTKMTEFLTVVVEDIRDHNQEKNGVEVISVLQQKAINHPDWRSFFAECFSKLLRTYPNPEFFKKSMFDLCLSEYQTARNKKTALGNIEWLSELVKRNILNKDVVHKILDDMYSQDVEQLKVEVWCKLMAGCGNNVNTEKYFEKLSSFKTMGSRIRSTIMDLEDLQRNR